MDAFLEGHLCIHTGVWKSPGASALPVSPWGERVSDVPGTVRDGRPAGRSGEPVCQGGAWITAFSPRVFPDALAPSFRGYFSGLEVPSVLLNAL